MDKGVWEETVREDADVKVMELCNRCEGRICIEEGEGVPVIKGGERGGKRICERTIEKEVYSAVKVTTNSTGVLCREERWQK